MTIHQRFYVGVATFLFIMGTWHSPVWGAVGCDLNNPDRDVARLFPGSTGFKTVSVEVQTLGGDQLLAKIEAKLRDQLRGLYETIDVPYTIYVIYAKDKKIGYIHGVTQKGRFGGIQIFLVLDLEERIKSLYIQKMSGAYAGKFYDKKFRKQFAGLTLADFEKYEVATGQATGKVATIKNPAPEADHDFKRILRGVKKNLILVNEFLRIAPELSAPGGESRK
jgi:hypothetical protein